MTSLLTQSELCFRLNHADIEKSILEICPWTRQFLCIGRTSEIEASVDVKHGVEAHYIIIIDKLVFTNRVLTLHELARFAPEVPGVFIRDVDCTNLVKIKVFDSVDRPRRVLVDTFLGSP